MKISSVPWLNKPSFERTPLSSRTKLRSFLLWRYLLQVQLSRSGRVVRRNAPSRPTNPLRILSRYAVKCPQTTDAVPLDLSVTTGSKRAPGVSSKGPQSATSKEPIWRPLTKPSFPHAPTRKREWFPVSRKGLPPRPEPKFFPVVRAPRKPREPQFHWTNSLNHIFLQDRHVSDEDEAKDKKEEGSTPTDPKAPDSTSVGSHPSKYEKASSIPSLKPSVTNPFKMTPSNTWPVDTAEHHTKPILVPPKFGTNINSGFGKFASNTGGGGFPSAKVMGPLHPPTLSVTSPNETPKPTFKLKPPILGSSIAVTSSSFSIKRPASKVESEGGADSSSPHKGNGAASESPPEAKRPRTLPSAEGAPKSALPSGNEEKNGSGVSSSTSSEGKRSSSPSSSSSSSSSSSCLSPSLGRENASISTTSNTVPTFVPLSSTNMEASSSEESPARVVNGVGATSPPLSSKVGNAGFIFGQNLENRVSGVSSTSSGTASALRFSNGETNPSSSSTGLNLFTAAAASNLATPSSTCDGGKSLSETSREFSLKEESLKTKYEEVQTVTGEEGEKNDIQMNCKLYGWANGSWQERGRGILRLNDRDIRDELHSRLVVRTQGTLTVMLNAKIWAEMSIEKPNDKSVRFTASDADGQPKIYLVMGSPKDITLLHNSLEYRVAAARSQTLDEKEREADQLSDDVIPSLSV